MTHNMIGLLQSNGEVEEYANTNGGGGGSSKPVKVTYDTSPATKAHAVDSFIYYNNSVYKVTSAISIGDTLTVGTNISTDIGLEADTEICIDGQPDSGSGGSNTNFVGTRQEWEALSRAEQDKYDTVDAVGEDSEYQYSTTTPVYTGRKWVDGKKIYVIVLGGTIGASTDVSSLNIDTIITFNSTLYDSSGQRHMVPLPYDDLDDNNFAILYYSIGEDLIRTEGSSYFQGKPFKTLIEFTQATS